MRWLLVLLALIVPVPASAQVVKIVKPECGPVKCRFYIGTGVIVGREPTADQQFNQYWILTVHHVSGNRWDALVKQRIRKNVNYNLFVVAGGARFPASIVNANGDLFLMLLTCKIPVHVPAMAVMPIATVDPQAGQAVAIHGHSYKRNGEYGQRSVTIRSYGPTRFEITSPFEEGESGGPIVKNGQIVGLCEGYDVRTKNGFGPSLGAIRGFLSFPHSGNGDGSGTSGQVPVSSGLPVQSGGMSVPPPPEPTDAPKYSPPVHSPREVTPPPEPTLAPRPEPDPRTGPVEDEDDGSQGTPIPIRNQPTQQAEGAGQTDSPEAPTVGRKLANAASTGLDIWAMLAGAGIVVGTGGIGGLALLAWRGFRAARTVSAVRGKFRKSRANPPESTSRSSVTPVPAPQDHSAWNGTLPPHDVRFVPIPNDYRKASVDFALEQAGRRYPGAIPTVEVIKSMINQHLQATGHGPDTLHS